MQANELLKRYEIRDRNFDSATLIEVETAHPKPGEGNLSDVLLYKISFSCIFGWAILFLILSIILTVARTEIFVLKRSHQVPCRNCRFFSSNPYVKCAVHPCTALTKQAIYCSDYLPQQRKFSH